MTISHDAEDQKFTATEDGHPAELAYSRPGPDTVDFTHTYVDGALRGRGLADELARAGLAYARQEGLTVKTSCSFMQAFVQRHQAEYQDLVSK
ncbi:GNAT family N-acetyltransferase [uncultured Hymenobacter sp.]|uniref:GNAT family N-acetyltransferase n=1 Tax=uncultured Hymenobacter sp. TaxID=170016 RepID=UPI0035CC50F2